MFEGLPHAYWAYLVAPESTEAFELMAGFFTKFAGLSGGGSVVPSDRNFIPLNSPTSASKSGVPQFQRFSEVSGSHRFP